MTQCKPDKTVTPKHANLRESEKVEADVNNCLQVLIKGNQTAEQKFSTALVICPAVESKSDLNTV